MDQPFCIDSRKMRYQVHPITVFEVLDHHRRRRDQERVFGLLVGQKRKRLIEVTGALNIRVRINEENEDFEITQLAEMLKLHKASCPKDEIVGMYTTWHHADYWLAKIHDDIKKKVAINADSLFLVVGVGNGENRLRISGYVSKTLFGICRYVGVPVSLTGSEGENLGVWTLMNAPQSQKAPGSKLWTSGEVVQAEMKNVEDCLSSFKNYVEDESQRREEVGWDLAASLSEVPCIPEHEFESMISGSIQDLLMTDCLSKLNKVHVNLAGKLGLQKTVAKH